MSNERVVNNHVKAKTARVYLPCHIFREIEEHIHYQPDFECGGFLIGDRVDLADCFIFTVRAIYKEPIVGEHASFEFSLPYCSNAVDFLDSHNEKNGYDDYIIGTYHSHASFDAFVSGIDERFARRYALLIIVSPSTKNIVVKYLYLDENNDYRWAEGELIIYGQEEEIGRKNRVIKEVKTTIKSGMESFNQHSYYRNKIPKQAKKRVLVVGAGTLGNLLGVNMLENSLNAEITFVDRDLYEEANLPRSPMIDNSAVGQPKAFALAKAYAIRSNMPYYTYGIMADIRKLSLDFYEKFEVIVSPLDNLECRFYLSYCALVLGKPFINLGTMYKDLNGKPRFSGDVLYKSAVANVCLDDFYPMFKANETLLRKRVSCGGALPEEITPQVISSSMLVATYAYKCIKKALSGDKSNQAIGYNINDIVHSFECFDSSVVKPANCCSFYDVHNALNNGYVKTITVSKRIRISSLYKLFLRSFSENEVEEYSIDMMASGLTQIKYRTKNPINSILVTAESSGRLSDIIEDDYFPGDYIFVVKNEKSSHLIRIKINKRRKL